MKVIFILDQSRKFANNSPLKSVCIYGGTSVPHQINQIKQGVNVLVATPGRLLDFLDKGFISFRYAINQSKKYNYGFCYLNSIAVPFTKLSLILQEHQIFCTG